MRSRPKIIAATVRIVERDGFAAATVAAVADEAGVSRQTIYSIFGTREDLVSQATAELATAWFHEIAARIDNPPDAEGFIVEAVVAGRNLVRSNPLLARALAGVDGSPLLDPGMIDRAVAVARALLDGAVRRDPRYAPVLDDVTELVTRVALSVVAFDSERIAADDDLRAALRRWLVPSLSAMVADAPSGPARAG